MSVGSPSGTWSVARTWLLKQRRTLMLALLVFMFVVTALAPRIFITIPAGHGGILWLRFFGGTQTDQNALGEGLQIIFPWDEIYIYDMRVQEREQAYQVIAREGLQVTVRSSFRWQLNRATLPRLHKEIGPDYVNVLLIPEVGSVLRERISQYNIEELFSSRRTQIQNEILKAVVADNPDQAPNRIGSKSTAEFGEDYVTLTDVLLKDITLPFRLRSAIERKLEQAQISQEYTFRIERERLESQRKLIEAQGIQAFQQTVQAGISNAYLKWRGIEATMQLATSQNAKVVVIGGGANGLPLILNTEDANARAQPAAPQAAPPATVADPAKLTKTSPDDGAPVTGSINPIPPKGNSEFENFISQSAATQTSEAAAARAGAAKLGALSAPDAPPYILRSFADAFGYRLQPSAPSWSASVEPFDRAR